MDVNLTIMVPTKNRLRVGGKFKGIDYILFLLTKDINHFPVLEKGKTNGKSESSIFFFFVKKLVIEEFFYRLLPLKVLIPNS